MKTTSLLKRVDMHLALCAAAGASFAGVRSAEADIIYSGPVYYNIPSNLDGLYLNVVTGVRGSSSASVPGWDLSIYGVNDLILFNPMSPTGGVYLGSSGFYNLSLGTVIGPGSTYSSGTISASSPRPLAFNSADNLIGFRFQNETMGNQTQYGWLRIYLSATAGSQPRMLVDYAYENTGAAIGTPLFEPPLPEPTTLSLLSLFAVGAVGVRAWRKGKRQKLKSAAVAVGR